MILPLLEILFDRDHNHGTYQAGDEAKNHAFIGHINTEELQHIPAKNTAEHTHNDVHEDALFSIVSFDL